MLPPEPPNITYKDFDPSVEPEHDDVEDEDEDGNPIEISSVEINILIYLYLLESNFAHTAFTLLAESNLPQTSLFQYFNPGYGSANGATGKSKSAANGTPGVGKSPRDGLFGNPSGRIPRGELVRKLWKAVRWEEVERHITPEGQPYKPTCPNPFHLIVPHLCPPGYPSAQSNPTTTPPTWKRQSPSTRAEAFPAPPNERSTAGPSRRRIAEENDNDKGKRKKRDSTSPRRRIADGSRSKVTDDSSETGSKLKRGVNAREKEDENDNSASEGVGRRNKKSRLAGSRLEVKQPDSRSRTRSPANGAASRNRSRQSSVETEEQAGKDHDNEEGNDDENEDEDEDDEEGDGDMDVTDEAEERERAQEEEEKKQRDDERKARPGWIDERYIGYLREHRDGVSALAFNPKNRDVLVSGSSDGTAKLWDFVTQKSGEGKVLEAARKPTTIAIKTIESNMKAVTCLSWHPDGTVLAVGSLDGTGRLFTPSGQLQGIMSYGRGSIRAIKFSPDGSRILIAKTDFTVALWLLGSSHDQRMLRTFNNHTAEVNDVDWLDEQVFASCANDKKVLIYRASDTRATFTLVGHTDDITRIKWQPKSRPGQPDQERLLASASDDGTVRIWSLPDYPKGPGSVTGSVGSRSVSPMKQKAMEEDEEMLDLGSIKAARVLEVVKESENLRMDSVEWAPGGEIIAAGGQDTTVKLFNALTGELLHVLKGLEEGTGSFAFSPISKGLIAGGGWNGHLMLWDVKTGEVKGEYEFDEDATKQRVRDKPMNLAMKWRDDGEHLVVGLANKEIMLVHTAEVGK